MIHPSVCFNGCCEEAVLFYTKVFGCEIPHMVRFGDMPAHPDFPMSEEMKGRIAHTQLELCGGMIMFADSFHEPVVMGNNIDIVLMIEHATLLQTYFEGLKQGGEVIMELQKTEWSECYGIVMDKFGISWQLNQIK